MAKLHELEKYLHYTFSTGCDTGEDYKSFQRKYINYLRTLCKESGWELIVSGKSHYWFSVFIRNQAGAQWLGEITAEDIAEIKMISGGGGPLPPVSKTHISSSRNKAVIESIFEEYYWLDSTPVSEERTQIADGGYFIVQFIFERFCCFIY